jgi:Mrp family chromosome partitioning ATPase
VADASEAERITGARVLATVRPLPPVPERARRRADREVSPLIDQVSDTYHLLYTQLAAPSFKLPLVAVVGDTPAVTATVAANLAAAVSRHARSTLLVDTDFETHSVASVMRLRAMPGLADVLTRRLAWPEAIVSALVGRERTIDVLTSGTPTRTEALHAAVEEFNRELTHLARRFDTVVVSAPSSRRGTTPAFVSAVGPVVVCVRVARTKIATLRQLAAALEAHGATVRGLLLWEVDDPALSLPPDADAMLSRPPTEPVRAAAAESSAAAERPASLG